MIDPAGALEVSSLARGWVVEGGGDRIRCRNFAELLGALARVGPAVFPDAGKVPERHERPLVELETDLEPGFAGELMWWIDVDSHALVINGLEFDRIYEDAPSCDPGDGVPYATVSYSDDYMRGDIPYYRVGCRIIELEWEAMENTVVGTIHGGREGMRARLREWNEHSNGNAWLSYDPEGAPR